ncbi:MAG: efflux RND transporter periplasmic adaptor subunit [Dysgonamonadaceae bacterium]|nr:efflux RND transporter periplasmic adaptor subunit [Dysgonamonadaceae bacterium]
MKKQNNNPMKNFTVNYLLVIVLLSLAACSSKNDATTSDEMSDENLTKDIYELSSTQFNSSDMKLGKLEMQEFYEIVKANGMFNVPPQNRASVSSYFGGSVKDIKLQPGQHVKRGQVLFTLENPEFVQLQQDFLESQGQLSYLKSDYERQKNLVEDNVTSQKNYLKSESDYTVTRARHASLRKKLELLDINPNALTIDNIRATVTVTAPINGYVTDVNITKGSFLNPSNVAMIIVDTDHLQLELNIFEKDLAKVRIGQPIHFRIQEDQSQQYEASVYLVNKTVDAEKRTIGILGQLSDAKLTNRFNPGVYVQADIYTTSDSRPSLPQEALVEVDDKNYVLVLDSSSDAGLTFIKKEVKTGVSNNDDIEIMNAGDFNENSEFLVKGAFNLIKE